MEVWIKIIVILLYVIYEGFSFWLAMLNYRNRNRPMPKSVQDVYDEDQYQNWKKYYMEHFKLSFVFSAIGFFVLLIMLAFNLFVYFVSLAKSITNNVMLETVIVIGFYYFITYIISIFKDYIATFKIEEKYGFNKMTKSLFIIDKIKALVLTVIFGGGAIYAIIGLFISVGDWFLLVAWIAVTVIFVFVNMIYTKWIVPIFNKLKPLEDSSLKTKIFAFAKSVGYEVGKISVMNASKRSTKLNAFFSGFSKTARVVLYDTLIEKMDEEEVVAVLAHEIGHNKRKHIVFNIFQTVLLLSVYIFGLMIFLRQDIFSLAFGLSEINYGFNIIVYVVVLSIVMLFLNLPLSFLSRKFEYQADEFASKNYSDLHMINALIKLSRENFSNLNPHPLYVKFYYTHPPLYQRIAAIKS